MGELWVRFCVIIFNFKYNKKQRRYIVLNRKWAILIGYFIRLRFGPSQTKIFWHGIIKIKLFFWLFNLINKSHLNIRSVIDQTSAKQSIETKRTSSKFSFVLRTSSLFIHESTELSMWLWLTNDNCLFNFVLFKTI